jgi:histidyl-tRNA synthetase
MIIEVKAPDDVKIGSIGGGGRYDDLTSNFGLKNMSGIGISFGFERIYLVMNELGIFPETLTSQTQVLFANFGEKAAQVAYYYLNQLRNKNITGELYPTEAKLKKQLNYANSKGIQKVILIGSEELEGNSFILKNMLSGDQTSHGLPDLINLFN